ncbi:TPA: hypothetical protein NHP88_002562 [Pseudomonas aeruginosa]|nr:hypothetical protein [Pseudomonas aeruginosa]
MTKANECTCPSGDGSLRHPCPAHPAAEQAGGDERAAFRPAQVISYRPGVGEVTIYVAGRVPGYMNIGDTVYVSDRAPVEQPSAALAQPSPAQAEQAEAERPEVVASVVHSNPVVLGQCGPLNANDELMTVAQHAASVARWAEMFNRVEQQRDAALVEVEALRAELQSQRERNTELIFKLGSATNGWGRCEKERDAALARVAELEKQQPAGYLRVVNGRTELADGPVRPADRSGGYATPWQAIYTRPVAQAQHSVPEEFIGRLSEFLAQRGATGKALLRELRDMLAAAPGKEVGHE